MAEARRAEADRVYGGRSEWSPTKGFQEPEAGFAPEHVVSGGLEALCRYLAGNGVGLPVPTKMLIPPPRQ
ncbi:hypothetical protein ACIG8K_10620 [Streptomyces halstedii]|uniref:hypothetical protein n=1 Tax=Streptomyces halstedii TaxID=1944 RepID=UPI0037D4EB04